MYRPTTTRAALVLATLIGCGGSIPEDTLVQEADPVALSATTLPMTAPLESIEESADAAPEFLAASNTEIDPGLDSSSDSGTAPSVEIEGVEITVRTGETLVGLSSVAGVSVEAIVDANAIDARDPLHPGQELLIPLSGDLAHAFTEARDFARADRLDRYVAGRGGLVGVESYSVRTGETAWGISREQAGVPVWVLAAFNSGTSLDSLGIGQRVKVPVFADSVAAADEPMDGDGEAPTEPTTVE